MLLHRSWNIILFKHSHWSCKLTLVVHMQTSLFLHASAFKTCSLILLMIVSFLIKTYSGDNFIRFLVKKKGKRKGFRTFSHVKCETMLFTLQRCNTSNVSPEGRITCLLWGKLCFSKASHATKPWCSGNELWLYSSQCCPPDKVTAILLTSYNMPSIAPSASNASGFEFPNIDVSTVLSIVTLWIWWYFGSNANLQSRASVNF